MSNSEKMSMILLFLRYRFIMHSIESNLKDRPAVKLLMALRDQNPNQVPQAIGFRMISLVTYVCNCMHVSHSTLANHSRRHKKLSDLIC